MDKTAAVLGMLGNPKSRAIPPKPARNSPKPPEDDGPEESDPIDDVSDAVDSLKSALDSLPDEYKPVVQTCIEELETNVLQAEQQKEDEP